MHARSSDRVSSVADLTSEAAGVVAGDLRSAAEIHGVAEQVNAIGRMDAVIHNAGVYNERSRGSTPEGHAVILAVNTLAGIVTLSNEDHEKSTSRVYSGGRNCRAPRVHRRSTKASMRSG